MKRIEYDIKYTIYIAQYINITRAAVNRLYNIEHTIYITQYISIKRAAVSVPRETLKVHRERTFK